MRSQLVLYSIFSTRSSCIPRLSNAIRPLHSPVAFAFRSPSSLVRIFRPPMQACRYTGCLILYPSTISRRTPKPCIACQRVPWWEGEALSISKHGCDLKLQEQEEGRERCECMPTCARTGETPVTYWTLETPSRKASILATPNTVHLPQQPQVGYG